MNGGLNQNDGGKLGWLPLSQRQRRNSSVEFTKTTQSVAKDQCALYLYSSIDYPDHQFSFISLGNLIILGQATINLKRIGLFIIIMIIHD